jgi:holliday junction DNA helicase RuvA
VALAILSSATAADLRRAIAREDVARFQAIPGIGKKTAERIVLELKEKLGSVVEAVPQTSGDLLARDALVELGWTVGDAERALARVDQELTVEEQVRLVLREAA